MPPRKRTTRASKKAEAAAAEAVPSQPEAEPAADVAGATEQTEAAAVEAAEPSAKRPSDKKAAPTKSKSIQEPSTDNAPEPAKSAEPTEPTERAEPAEPAEPSKPSVPAETAARATPTAPAVSAADRMARFKALQARAKTSSDQNLKAAAAESQRLSTDGSQLTALRRKHAVASHKMLKAEVEDEGGDFERKRAWDWTVEESERWDKRLKKKAAHRDNAAFQDYTQEANKVYKKQVRHAANLAAPDLEQYARDKLAAVERAAAQGTLEIVETADGELIAVDKDGSFFSTAESTAFADNRPSKEAIDRLVNDQRKADEAALRKRRERLAKNGDDADVTYINDKNKQFNQKLARFYNKYTAEIRESFERGTMI